MKELNEPPPSKSYEYMIATVEQAPDSRGGQNHAYPILVPERTFSEQADVDAYARARYSHAIVVCVPVGYRVTRIANEITALNALSDIELLGTGHKRMLPDVAAIQSVVEMCRRVFHAFRTTRERTLKELLAGVVKDASYKQLNRIAIALNVLPQALNDDPFEPSEEVEERATAKPFTGHGPVPDDCGERGGGNDRLDHRRS